MNVRDLIVIWLRTNGYDGLATNGCGCGIDDLAPCDGCDILDNCKPAKLHACDGTCSGCHSTGQHDRVDNCYRSAEPAEPEETHL